MIILVHPKLKSNGMVLETTQQFTWCWITKIHSWRKYPSRWLSNIFKVDIFAPIGDLSLNKNMSGALQSKKQWNGPIKNTMVLSLKIYFQKSGSEGFICVCPSILKIPTVSAAPNHCSWLMSTVFIKVVLQYSSNEVCGSLDKHQCYSS